MSKLLNCSIVVLMIVGFTGCAVDTNAIEIDTSISKKVNIDGYKTYEILEGSGMINAEERMDNMDVNAEMRKMITAELAKKGKTEVTENPDFYVEYVAGTDEAVDEKLIEDGKKTIVKKAPEATMVLVIIDAETDIIIGISTATGEVKGLPAEESKKRLNYVITKMLSDL